MIIIKIVSITANVSSISSSSLIAFLTNIVIYPLMSLEVILLFHLTAMLTPDSRITPFILERHTYLPFSLKNLPQSVHASGIDL